MFPEVERRLVHASGGLVPALYVLDIVTWRQFQAILVAGSVVTIVLEAVRLFAGIDWIVFDQLTREYEEDSVAGYALYVLGGTAAGLLFPPSAAVAALFMLAIGDPIGGMFGSGKLRRVKRPSVLAVMFTVCSLIGLVFVPPVVAVLGGAGAAIADGVKPMIRGHVVDDNLTIPLVAGGLMAAAVTVL